MHGIETPVGSRGKAAKKFRLRGAFTARGGSLYAAVMSKVKIGWGQSLTDVLGGGCEEQKVDGKINRH